MNGPVIADEEYKLICNELEKNIGKASVNAQDLFDFDIGNSSYYSAIGDRRDSGHSSNNSLAAKVNSEFKVSAPKFSPARRASTSETFRAELFRSQNAQNSYARRASEGFNGFESSRYMFEKPNDVRKSPREPYLLDDCPRDCTLTPTLSRSFAFSGSSDFAAPTQILSQMPSDRSGFALRNKRLSSFDLQATAEHSSVYDEPKILQLHRSPAITLKPDYESVRKAFNSVVIAENNKENFERQQIYRMVDTDSDSDRYSSLSDSFKSRSTQRINHQFNSGLKDHSNTGSSAVACDSKNKRKTSNASSSQKADIVKPSDLINIKSGIETRTTFMIRNIPNKYTQQQLVDFINMSQRGNYDFVYLRIDFNNKCNLGYAFVNFTSAVHAMVFTNAFNDRRWPLYNSEKCLSMCFASIQSLPNLTMRFRDSR